MVYVAERANGGGRVLGFNLPNSSGNIAPLYNDLHTGASAIYFADGNGNNLIPPVVISNFDAELVVDNTPTAVTFKIYPNPAINNLTLELPNLNFATADKTTIVIYDAFGKQMQQINNYAARQTIDISSLSDGIYYIMVTQNDQLTTQKFIKTK